jgi:hypothetical protein
LYASTTSSGPHEFAFWWTVAIGLTVLYLAAASWLYVVVDRKARMSGELALA